MLPNSDSMFARIDLEIEEGKYYESMQHIVTLVKRHTMRKNYEFSLKTLYKYALLYLDKKQYVLAGELMDEFSKTSESGERPFTEDDVDHIILVFETPWKTSPEAATFKETKEYQSTMSLFTKFMNRAILWSKCESYPHGHPLLHMSLGEYYMVDKQFNKSQAHLVYSQDVETLFALVNEWKQQGNPEEGDFFYLRAVLMLLAANDVCNAKCFVILTEYDVEDAKVGCRTDAQTPIPIQFAHLMSEACEPPNFELFQKVCETYKQLINMDKEFANLVRTIKDIYFKEYVTPLTANQPGLQNTLTNFLQALM